MKKLLTVFIVCLVVLALSTASYAGATSYDYLELNEQASTPTTPESGRAAIYPSSDGSAIIILDDAGSTVTIGTGSGDNTLDNAYDEGGGGAGKAITVDTGAIALSNTDADSNALLTINASPSSAAAAEGLVITIGSNSTGAALEFENSGSGYDVEGSGGTWSITKAGVATFASVPMTTLSVSSTSTLQGDVTLDDGSGASPSLILTDATNETATFSKVDSGYLTITTAAADGAQVLTGNLKIGNGTPDETINGEDFYCEGISEFDGEATFDGNVEFDSTFTATGAVTLNSTLALSEDVTFTAAADESLVIDAATTDSTETAGALDINFDYVTNGAEVINVKATFVAGGGGSEYVSAVVIDIDDDSDAAGTISGIRVDASDATGSSAVVGLAFESAAGADTTLETCIVAQLPAAGVYLALDAAGTANTGAEGALDINYDSATAAAAAINVKVTHVAGGSGQKVAGIEIEVDSDADNGSDETYGLLVNVTDATDSGTLTGVQIEGAGLDIGLQIDHGGAWIGTGGTADETQGDDTLYVEGTTEVDGVAYFDGNIDVDAHIVGIGSATTQIKGMTRVHESYTDADNVITIAEAGSIFDNTGDADGSLHTLPEASTCIGATFTFVITAAQQMIIELDNADKFLHLTLDAGDQIQSSTVNDSITVMAISASEWAVLSVYPLAADWADGGA